MMKRSEGKGAVLGGIAIFFFLVPTIHAAPAKGTCNITPDLKTFVAFQNAEGESQEKLGEELAVRKNAIAAILDCAIEDAEKLREELSVSPLPASEKKLQEVRARLEGELKETAQYYEEQKAALGGVGISGSKALAKRILEWRTSVALPLSEKVNGIAIWIANQDLIRAADRRFTQINRTAQTLHLDQNETIRSLLEEARATLDNAQRVNEALRTSFGKGVIPGNVLAETKTSLEALKHAYEIFFSIGEEVNAILPLE